MTRAELIRLFVLDSICDYYEAIEQITVDVSKRGLECGMTISQQEIIQALRELIETGWARWWDLLRRPPEPREGIPPVEEITQFGAHFFITPKGMEVEMADHPGWPFDDKGDLRAGWTAPAS